MRPTRRTLFGVWAVTSLIVLGVALLAYWQLTRIPLLAGRTAPVTLYSDPAVLFEDPGLIGTAIEMRVTAEIRSCMQEQGFSYRGPAVAEDLNALLGPDSGYGIAAGPLPRIRLGAGGPDSNAAAYERALFGATLSADASISGCAVAGRRVLDESVAAVASMPYSIDQLEIDAANHPAAIEAERAWAGCMALKGYDVSSPLELLADHEGLLRSVGGEEARRLAERERVIATADRNCRRQSIDRAVAVVAADLAPVFIAQNRVTLETLIPVPTGNSGGESLGTGDVQVTLRWGSAADLDLQVTDPGGAEINFSARTSVSGGELDRDANYPCDSPAPSPVENIYWPAGSAPGGSYQVSVNYRNSCGDFGPQAFEIVVHVAGREVVRERATIQPLEILTYGFEYSG